MLGKQVLEFEEKKHYSSILGIYEYKQMFNIEMYNIEPANN
jgi:hypothetical protein